MWSRLLAVLLVLAIWPALSETVELAVHFADHGDLAHDPAGHPDDRPLGTDEHGCSGTFHLCAGGQAGVIGPAQVTLAAIAPPRVRVTRPSAPLDASGLDAPMPPIRPPIA